MRRYEAFSVFVDAYSSEETVCRRQKQALRGLCMGVLFYSLVKCTGAPKYPYKDILVHR